MPEAPFDWTSFWDLVSPEEAAALLRETYGAGAAEAAAQSVAAARSDNRESDLRFWLSVSVELGKPDDVAPAASKLLPQ